MRGDHPAGAGHSRSTREGRALLSWQDALNAVLGATPVLGAEVVPAGAAAGRVLAEEVRADRDSPPFDRSAMDGYALRSGDAAQPGAVLEIVDTIAAGRVPSRRVGPGTAARIFTGSAIPEGADAVQMQERTELLAEGKQVRILEPVPPGANIRRRGEEVRAGEIVLRPGCRLGGAEIGVLAWTGRDPVRVHLRPRVALVATGDELVDAGETPAEARIRNSNTPMLRVLVDAAGGIPEDLGIARDDGGELPERLERGLRSDLLLVTGGVSVGDRDLVRPALEALGAQVTFHGVAIQPGKPTVFARRGETLVFGLPGNPVSCFVIFHCLVVPAIRKLGGALDPGPSLVRAALAQPVRRNPRRLQFLQARLETGPEGFRAAPVATTGSSDLHSCTRGNAMILVPPGEGALSAGEQVDVLLRIDLPRA